MAGNGDERYMIYTLTEHARNKGMWAGAQTRATMELMGAWETPPPIGGEATEATAEATAVEAAAPTYVLRPIERDHTPAVLHVFTEIMVNASDHAVACAEIPSARQSRANQVTRIDITFDRATGEFTCENDGPGIPVYVHQKASAQAGHEVCVPEVVFAMWLSGTNLVKPADSCKGGVNGLGGKLANVNASRFMVETVDGERGLHYMQMWKDRMRVRVPPRILNLMDKSDPRVKALGAARRHPHTKISFVPAFAELGYAPHPAPEEMLDIEAWLRWQAFQLAAYASNVSKATVRFNGEVCATRSAKKLAELVVGPAAFAGDIPATIVGCKAVAPTAPHDRHAWDIAVAIVPGRTRFGHITVINGVGCTVGPHIAHFRRLISEAAEKKVQRATKDKKKKLTLRDTTNQIFLVVVGALPGADWGGQRKDELMVPAAVIRKYVVAAAPLGKMATAVADLVLAQSEEGGRRRRKAIDKYTRAHLAGGRQRMQCRLLAAEGDSAIAFLRAGLGLGARKNPGGPTFQTHGIISLQGVVMNALREVTVVRAAGGAVTVRSQRLRNNKALQGLVDALGLDYTCKYETPAEIGRLSYGALVLCVDQDLDGCGKILTLVLVFIHTFWPALIAQGYVRWFMTPVVRVYKAGGDGPRGSQTFFYENEFDEWIGSIGGKLPAGAQKPKYYKGLAAHDKREVAALFGGFGDSVYTFELGDAQRAQTLFATYYGPDPGPRKVALSTPVRYPSAAELAVIHGSRRIPIEKQLSVDAKAYKREAIRRQIPQMADGLTPARRKALAAALSIFKGGGQEMKVFQFAARTAYLYAYHHGDASLNRTVTGMGGNHPGSNRIPLIQGVGMFGSRHNDDVPSARYISVKGLPSTLRLFPHGDKYLLDYEFVEGERAEPAFYVPVLPTALLNDVENPSEGWRHKSFARDFAQVAAAVKAFTAGDPVLTAGVVAVEAYLAASAAAGPADAAAAEAGARLGDVAAAYPLDVSLWGYGDTLPDDAGDARAQLVRSYKNYEHSFGYYIREVDGSGKTTIRVVELPQRVSTSSFTAKLTVADTKTKGKPTGARATRAALIEGINDESGDTSVDIRVHLRPGAWETIAADFGRADADPVEEFLLLRESLKPNLNYLSNSGEIRGYGDNYHAVLLEWLPIRRDLYRRRLERERVALALRIELETNIVRYIGMARELDVSHAADEAAAEALLTGSDFPRLNAGLISQPGYTPVEELVHRAHAEGVSYSYALDLKERDLVEAAAAKRRANITAMQARLAEVGESLVSELPFPGAAAWRAEIEAAESEIIRLRGRGWRT